MRALPLAGRAPPREAARGFTAAPLPGAPADATFVDVDGVHVRYREAGTGPAVVLIHGFGASSDSWLPVIPAARGGPSRDRASTSRALAGRAAPRATTARPRRRSWSWDVLDKLGVNDVAIVGHSWGTSVALDDGGRAARARAHASRCTTPTSTTSRCRASSAGRRSRRPRRGCCSGCSTTSASRTARPLAYYDERWVTQARVDRVEADLARPAPSPRRSRPRAAITSRALHRRAARASTKPVLLLWGEDDLGHAAARSRTGSSASCRRELIDVSALRPHPDGRGAQPVDARPRRVPREDRRRRPSRRPRQTGNDGSGSASGDGGGSGGDRSQPTRSRVAVAPAVAEARRGTATIAPARRDRHPLGEAAISRCRSAPTSPRSARS